jgi:hypothetical protein
VRERGPLEPDKVAFHRQTGDLDLESAEHRSKASGQGEEGAS